MEGALSVFEAPTSRPVLHDLQLEYIEESDSDSSSSSESDHIDEQTEATTVDHIDKVDRASSRDPKLCCDTHDRDLHNLHLTTTIYDGQENLAPGTYVNGQNFSYSEVLDAPLGSTGTVTDKDQLAIELEQDAGSGRLYHQLGTSDETPGPGAEDAIDIRPNLELIPNNVNALWISPEESTSEAKMVMQRLDEIMPPAPTIDSHSHMQVANTPLYGTSCVSEPSMAAISEEEPAPNFSTAEDEQPPTEQDWQVSAPPLNAALQIRLNVVHGKIHRLMSTTGNIDFNVDIASFANAHVEPPLVYHVIEAARSVAREFTRLRLGITFAYAPSSRREVFCIRCDPSIPFPTLAQAFFPSQQRGSRGWQLRISPFALHPYHFQQDPQHMIRTLAHEFMHILGFRHYNAGSNEDGAQLSSVLWPNTIDGNPNSIMHTPAHNQLWFSAEDVQVLRELYSRRNGELVGGHEIRDVNAHNRR